MQFQFFIPTKMVMGEDCILKNPDVFAHAGRKALIVTGKSSSRKNGSLADVTAVLRKNGQGHAVFDKVMSNPTVDCVYAGAAAAKKAGADFIVAIGGGSPMDAAKAVAVLACRDIGRQDLFSGEYGDERLPMLFVPTTAGTGSEVTPYAVLTNDAARTKMSMASPVLFPDYAFLDPKYTEGLSREITVNTALDALSHAVEGSLSRRATEISDALAFQSMRMIASQFGSLESFTLGGAERGTLLYASALAGIVIAHTGTTAVHSMGYPLTYFKNIDHGRANGLLLAEFLRLVQRSRPDKVQAILKAMGLSVLVEFSNILKKLLGAPEKISPAELAGYASAAAKAKNIANCVIIPTERELLDIYETVFLEEKG